MKRPFLPTAIFFIVGILIATFIKIDYLLPFYLLAVFAILLFCLDVKIASTAGFYLLIVLCGVVVTVHSERQAVPPDYSLKAAVKGGVVEFQGVVLDKPSAFETEGFGGAKIFSHRYILGELSVVSDGGLTPLNINAQVSASSKFKKPAADKNDIIRFFGKAAPLELEGSPLSLKGRLISRKVGLRIYAAGKRPMRIIGVSNPGPFERLTDFARKRVMAPLCAGLPDNDVRRLIVGMILGGREDLSEDVSNVFLRTNTIHILAISGQQVTLVFFIILGILNALFVSKRTAAVISIPVIIVYAAVVGNEPSVFRSAIMMLVILLGWILKRESDIINSVAFSALFMLAINPFDLYDVGFQLSYIVILALVVLTPAVQRLFEIIFRVNQAGEEEEACPRMNLLNASVTAVSVCVSAWIGSAPIIIYYFKMFSLVSIPANLWTAALVGFIIIPLGFVSTVFGQVSLWAASAFNAFNALAVQALVWGNKLLSELPCACFQTGTISVFDAAAFYGMILCFANWGKMKNFKFTRSRFISLLAVLCVFEWVKIFGNFSGMEVKFLDVGQGDSALIKCPNGKYILVDGGPGSFGSSSKRSAVSYIRSAFITEIDEVVITHPHSDHIGGLPAVFDKVKVGELITNGSTHPSAVYKKILEKVEKKGIKYREVKRGDEISPDKDVSVTVLWPEEISAETGNENNASIILKVSYRGTSFLLCGDAEKIVQEKIASSPADIKADIIKMPHHGSAGALDENFLGRVSPKIAVISVGRNNPFGHPSPATLNYLSSRGVKIYRTDEDGTVTVRVSEKGYKVVR